MGWGFFLTPRQALEEGEGEEGLLAMPNCQTGRSKTSLYNICWEGSLKMPGGEGGGVCVHTLAAADCTHTKQALHIAVVDVQTRAQYATAP